MLLSVAKSLALALSMTGQAAPQARSPIDGVAESIAILGGKSSPREGIAVLIDGRGFFLAASPSVSRLEFDGRMLTGRELRFRVVRIDGITQLLLLQASPWSPEYGTPVKMAGNLEKARIFAVMPHDVVLGNLTSTRRPGIMAASQRYVPLSEIQFESVTEPFGGAIVFTLDGKFVGILNATLSPAREPSSSTQRGSGNNFQPEFGPRGLTIGYAVGPSVTRRVVEGFRSPNQTPQHPSFGIFYRTTARGVEVDRVADASPARKAGFVPGDVIRTIDGRAVKTAIELAVELFETEIGEERVFTVARGQQVITIKATAASATPVATAKLDRTKV